MHKYKCLASCIVNGSKVLRSQLEHNHPSRKAATAKQELYYDETFENFFSDCIELKKESME